MTVIVLCKRGHKTEYNLLKWPASFPRQNWRCKQLLKPDLQTKCGEPLLDPEDGVIITPEVRPPSV